jgi:hypothetical protein
MIIVRSFFNIINRAGRFFIPHSLKNAKCFQYFSTDDIIFCCQCHGVELRYPLIMPFLHAVFHPGSTVKTLFKSYKLLCKDALQGRCACGSSNYNNSTLLFASFIICWGIGASPPSPGDENESQHRGSYFQSEDLVSIPFPENS